MRRIYAELRKPEFQKNDKGVELADNRGDIVFKTVKVWVVHYGIETTIEYVNNIPVFKQNTVAICEDDETGQIEMWHPELLKIIGLRTYDR